MTATTDYAAMTVAQLRKAAAGLVPNYRKMNKAGLVEALNAKVEQTFRAEQRAKTTESLKDVLSKSPRSGDIKTRRPDLSPKAKKTGRKLCEICGKRPCASKLANDGIEGMCRPCYVYASWENQHSDDDHAAILAEWLVNGRGRSKPAEIDECPVCQGKDPAKITPKTRAPKKAPTPRNDAKPVAGISHPKAARFAGAAKEAGWKIGSCETAKGITTLTVTAAGGEYIQISWDGPRCLNTGTTHKGTDGKVRKVRNASAARKILEG